MLRWSPPPSMASSAISPVKPVSSSRKATNRSEVKASATARSVGPHVVMSLAAYFRSLRWR